MKPAAPEIRTALESVLGSEAFSLSKRHRRFLKFIVEEALAGRSERLKGYTIAVEAFGRDENFDAQNDPYVRVEAGRLRKRLSEYYDTEGAKDPVRIEIVRGSYVPEFAYTGAAPASGVFDSRAVSEQRKIRVRLAAGGGLIVVIALAIGAALYWNGMPTEPPRASSPPSLRVQAFEDNSEADFQFFADGLTEEILVKLDRFRRSWGPITIIHNDDLSELDIIDRQDYSLSGSVSRIEDSIRVTARVVDTASGRQLWTRSFDEDFELRHVLEIQDRVAARITDVVRSPVGPVADAETEIVVNLPQDQLNAYHCTILFFHAIDRLTASDRESAMACLETHDAAGTLDESGLGALAVLHILDHRDGRDLIDPSAASLDKAYDAAQRALDLEGNTVVAHFAMAFLNLGRDRLPQARASTERILALNPPPSTLGIVAFLMVTLGDGESGMEMFELAAAESPRTSPLMYLAPSLYYLQQGEYEESLSFAERIDASEFLMAQVLWASLTALAGEMDRARLYVDNIESMHPRFPEIGRTIIDRWSLPDEISDPLIAGLELAGLRLN